MEDRERDRTQDRPEQEPPLAPPVARARDPRRPPPETDGPDETNGEPRDREERSRVHDHSIPREQVYRSCALAAIPASRRHIAPPSGCACTVEQPPRVHDAILRAAMSKSVLGSASVLRSASAVSLARNPATGGFDQVGDRRSQGDPRAPAGRDEAARGDRRVDDVAWPAGAVVASKRRPERPLDLVGECVDRGAFTSGDVPGAHRRVRSAKQPQGVNDVEDMDEVPCLRAVAMDRQAALGDRLVGNRRPRRPPPRVRRAGEARTRSTATIAAERTTGTRT